MLTDLLSECFAVDLEEAWERERTANALTGVAVRLHATGCSIRETTTIPAELGAERSHQAVWQWVHRLTDSVLDPSTASPSRVAVDETTIKINGDWSWLCAAIELDTKLILDVALFGRHGTDSAAAFLSRPAEKHDLSDTTLLVD